MQPTAPALALRSVRDRGGVSSSRDLRCVVGRWTIGMAVGGFVGVCLAGLVQSARSGDVPAFPQYALPVTMAVAYLGLGGLVLRHVPGHRAGRLMFAVGATSALQVAALCWLVWTPAAWVAQWAWWLPLGLLPVVLIGFPDAALTSRPARAAAAALTANALAVSVALAVAALGNPRALVLGEGGLSGRSATLATAALAGIALSVVGFAAVAASVVLRWRRGDEAVRRQLLGVAIAGVAVLIGMLLDAAGLPVSWVAEGAALPAGIAVAILRHRLFDLDLVLSRAVVWLLMWGVVVVAYVAVVDLVGGVVRTERMAPLALTAVVAVAFEPIRSWVQRRADRLLYGRRDSPYAVLSTLGRHLEDVPDPTAILPRLTEAITESLQLPYAAVELADRHGAVAVVSAHGRAGLPVERIPMVAHGQLVGALLVAPRRAGERFDRREQQLLEDLARQAAVAAESVRLTLDLQRSRERLVLAREEERRRLRAELHDGMGPALAGLRLQVRAARTPASVAARSTEQGGDRLLETLDQDLAECGRDLRTLVDRLRPPALDGGLAPALAREVARFDCPQLDVTLLCPPSLGPLPAAVEVAVYRVTAEALANVARHSGARRCTVTVSVGAALVLTVDDDGVGPAAAARVGGVGMTSMHERAEELGGTFHIAALHPHGTHVEVRLPLHLPVVQEGT